MFRGLVALLIVVAVVVAIVGMGRAGGSAPVAPGAGPEKGSSSELERAAPGGSPGHAKVLLPVKRVLECEDFARLEDKSTNGEVMLRVGKANMGQPIGYLESPDLALKRAGLDDVKNEDQGGLLPGKAFYEFEVPREDDYYVFLRAQWMDDCGNSVWIRCDEQPYVMVQDNIGKLSETSYKWTWHPVRQEGAVPKVFRLTAGPHTLELNTREDGPKFDKLLVATDATAPTEAVVDP